MEQGGRQGQGTVASCATEDFESHFENDEKSLWVTEQGSDMTRVHFRKATLGQRGRAASEGTKGEAKRNPTPKRAPEAQTGRKRRRGRKWEA